MPKELKVSKVPKVLTQVPKERQVFKVPLVVQVLRQQYKELKGR